MSELYEVESASVDSITILENLNGRIHGINVAAATSGTGDEGLSALADLVKDGIVEVQYLRPKGAKMDFPLYKLRRHYATPDLAAVDSTQ